MNDLIYKVIFQLLSNFMRAEKGFQISILFKFITCP